MSSGGPHEGSWPRRWGCLLKIAVLDEVRCFRVFLFVLFVFFCFSREVGRSFSPITVRPPSLCLRFCSCTIVCVSGAAKGAGFTADQWRYFTVSSYMYTQRRLRVYSRGVMLWIITATLLWAKVCVACVACVLFSPSLVVNNHGRNLFSVWREILPV